MAKRLTIEERLARITALRDSAPTPESIALLSKSLASKNGLVVAAAAETVTALDLERASLDDLEVALTRAFTTLMETPIKRDPLCRGKLAVAIALHDAGRFVDEVFAVGIEHVQPEPVWGGTQDTAADLRARCGLAFAELAHPDAINRLAVLLADPLRNARAGAAHALGNSGRLEAIGLLRYKAMIGDEEIDVFTETLRALLTLEPEESFAFITRFLSADTARAEAAALCIGESRNPAGLKLLAEWPTATGSKSAFWPSRFFAQTALRIPPREHSSG